jgi:hypothetical protein
MITSLSEFEESRKKKELKESMALAEEKSAAAKKELSDAIASAQTRDIEQESRACERAGGTVDEE